ncbi:hypothetical protein PIROE2DRAFT_14260, partial [Piromyces sp. E2]
MKILILYWGLLLSSILILHTNAYTKNCYPRQGIYCDDGYCCIRSKCYQKKLYDSKANILFAIDNSYSMLNGDRMEKTNTALANLADYMPDNVEMAYTTFSSSATDVEEFTKENVPQIEEDSQSSGTGFSSVFNKSYDYLKSKQENGNKGILIIITDGVPEHVESEGNDFQAMTNAINASSRLKNDGMTVYVVNVNSLCNVNIPCVDYNTPDCQICKTNPNYWKCGIPSKLDASPIDNEVSNNLVMKLISSEYENVQISYADGSTGNTGINIDNYQKVSGGEKYYMCPDLSSQDWSDLFTQLIKDELIDYDTERLNDI